MAELNELERSVERLREIEMHKAAGMNWEKFKAYFPIPGSLFLSTSVTFTLENLVDTVLPVVPSNLVSVYRQLQLVDEGYGIDLDPIVLLQCEEIRPSVPYWIHGVKIEVVETDKEFRRKQSMESRVGLSLAETIALLIQSPDIRNALVYSPGGMYITGSRYYSGWPQYLINLSDEGGMKLKLGLTNYVLPGLAFPALYPTRLKEPVIHWSY